MLFLVLFLVLAASAVHGHDEVVLPELPIPEIDQLFPVDDMAAAYRWADRESLEFTAQPWIFANRWFVVALSEGQFGQVGALLAGIQQVCPDGRDRFGVTLFGKSKGGVDDEYLWTLGRGYVHYDIRQGYHRNLRGVLYERYNHLLKTRFSVAGGQWAGDTELRDTGFEMQFQLALLDNARCFGSHTSHKASDGSARHNGTRHYNRISSGPETAWIPIADLVDGTVTAAPPAEPAEPEGEEPAEEEPADNAELERLQAENDALRGDLSAVRDSVDALLEGSRTAIGGGRQVVRDTVEVVRHDTLLFCPPTDEERRDLFDLFTGANDDTTETEGAGKAASVQLSSWGAVKALVQED